MTFLMANPHDQMACGITHRKLTIIVFFILKDAHNCTQSPTFERDKWECQTKMAGDLFIFESAIGGQQWGVWCRFGL